MWMLYVLAGLLVLAAMSAGLALGLHLLAPGKSEARRIMLAAGITTVLPMSIAFGGFLSEVDVADSEFLLSFAALTVTTLAVFTTCCLPAAWFATTRLGRSDEALPAIETVEPELIEG